MSEQTISFHDQGSGSPALLFLHYFAGSSRSWVHVAAGLSNASRCISLDLPGFGDTPPLASYSVHEMAHTVAVLAAGLSLENYMLVGHSMGGKIAAAYAATKPPGLNGLILVAPSPPSPEPMDDGERARLTVSHGDPASAERTVRTITRRSLPADDMATCISDNLRTSSEAWTWWLQKGSRENISEQVQGIACPVLVLSGSKDPVITPIIIDTDVIPKFSSPKHVQIAGAGHLLPLEAAQEVTGAIKDFAGLGRDG